MHFTKPLTLTHYLSLALSIATSIATLGTAPAAFAQSTSTGTSAPSGLPPSSVWSDTQQNPFSTGSQGVNPGNITDLIRRAGQPGIDWETFLQNQQRNLNDAASSFRALQQKRLGQPATPQVQSQPIAPTGTIAPSTAPLTR
jgi:hypothetical protein